MNTVNQEQPQRFFFLCTHFGLEVYVWLTMRELYSLDNKWDETRIDVYEDRDGEMIPHDVLLTDLELVERV